MIPSRALTRALAMLALAAGCGDDAGSGPDAAGDDPCLADGTIDLDGDMCDRLSSYGFFDDLQGQVPADGVLPYAINTALFSDYTDKSRFLVIPDGEAVPWDDTESFVLPVGSVVIKTFGYGADLLETRLLIRQSTGWTGAAYVYDDADAEAHLAIAGATIPVEVAHDGMTIPNDYAVPNKNQCKNCHEEHDDIVGLLGPKARHMNRDGQLEGLVEAGVLVGAPADPTTWPKAPVFDDPATGSVEERARAWLDINCAHCHNPTGAARTSGLDLRAIQTDPTAYGVCKPPIAAGGGSGDRPYSIVPGDPDQSILVYRIESTDPDVKMPELGRNLVHAEAVALIREWITAMPGTCN